ncbi:SpaA isopeptide-forming pilin-related protein [Thermophilibacter provencensis]|uniref:SpaA isopeptide-forming pilin-related protein n=1 Tax=Thermophilibacter provencensis TaxID=1852386 RepID=UPI0029420A4E|nr:SpaA isopeptide-forming pilin-related protein [Thermophilibacter provencensis]
MARSLRAIKRAGGTFKAMGALMALLSVLAVCVFAGAEMALANTAGASDYKADTDTSQKYTDIFGLGDGTGLSTRYAGRVWADKSVSAGDTVTFTGRGDSGQGSNTFTFNKSNDADFLVTYSAMATSQQIIELPQIPVDVVFVLDFSASMTWGVDSTTVSNPDGSDSRIKAMVDAMNETIDALAKANPENRIGIVVFNRAYREMLPLTELSGDNLNQVNNGEYLHLEDFTGTSGQDNGHAWVYCDINHGERQETDSKTNIQSGLYYGMQMLAEASDTTFVYQGDGKTYTRIPNIVLMSDGAPTTISLARNSNSYQDSTQMNSWWDGLATTNENGVTGSVGWGDNHQAQSANGFMAMLTAEVMKNKVADHYQTNARNAENLDELDTSMYTIGFGINQQNKSMVAMANMVLNPTYMFGLKDGEISQWNIGNQQPTDNADDQTGLQQVIEAKNQWTSYARGQNAMVHYVTVRNERNDPRNLNVEHPGRDDAASAWDAKVTPPSYVDAYYPAEDSDALQDAFHEITNAIVDSAKVPTEIGNGSPVSSGYITYTDPIGEYMEVKEFSGLLFGNTQFKQWYTEETQNGVRYYFSSDGTQSGSTSVDSPIYSDQNINNIIVTLSTDQTGNQALTVEIPASLIPLRVNTVEVNADGQTVETHTTNNVYPLRLVYSVGLKEGVVGTDNKIDENVVSAEYINSHKLSDGTVAFYSNLYDGENVMEDQTEAGNATVTFTPANDNPFYFIQEDTPLYTDQACTQPATGSIDQNGTYWFKISWYEGTGADGRKEVAIERSGSLLQSWVDSDAGGSLYLRKDAPRLGNLLDAVDVVDKNYENTTGTASHPYYPTFEGTPHNQSSQFKVYLGNNGRLSVSLPGPDVLPALQVTKNDADDASKTLEGAGFALYVDSNDAGTQGEFDENDTHMVQDGNGAAVVTTNENGIASFAPNKYLFELEKTYFLVETKAPDGYQLMDGAVKIVFSENNGEDQQYPEETHPFMATITFPGAESSETVYSSAATGPEGSADYQVATVKLTVSDKAIPSLPATGSNGRTALASTGVAAVTLGAYALWRRRRAFDQ